MDSSQLPVKRIILLGGWSPGPLPYLEHTIHRWQDRSSNHSQINVEIVHARNLPMPPIPGSWCCNPAVIIMFLVLNGLIYSAVDFTTGSVAGTIILKIFLVLLVVIWFRFLAAVAVRISIERGINIAGQEIYHQEVDPEQILLIGFSWGGAVLAEMIAQGMIGRPGQPSALLIAPTSSLVAKVAMQQDAPLRIASLEGRGSGPGYEDAMTTRVSVVHGSYDETSFCPNQHRWHGISGLEVHIFPDNHVMCLPSSVRVMTQIVEAFIGAPSQHHSSHGV